MRRRLRANRGFTLAELMMAMTLLVVGVFALASLMVTSIRADIETAHYSAARALAQTTLEQIRSSTARPSAGTIAGVTTALGPRATGTVSVMPQEASGQTALDLVTITLSWKEIGNATVAFKMDAYVCSGGVSTN